jgi:CRP/FNR family transcriptional regulator, cyclic AMP receptor protein
MAMTANREQGTFERRTDEPEAPDTPLEVSAPGWRATLARTFKETKDEARIITAGETVVPEGQMAPPLLVLTAGALSCSLPRPDGRAAVVGVLSAGEVFGGDPGQGFGPHPGVRALLRSRALVLAYPEFERLALGEEAVGRWVIRHLLGQLRAAQHHLARVTAPKVGIRLEAVLAELARSHGRTTSDGIRVALPLSQDLLGAMVGASRETVNRSLAQLIRQGRVARAGRSYVLPSPGSPEGP